MKSTIKIILVFIAVLLSTVPSSSQNYFEQIVVDTPGFNVNLAINILDSIYSDTSYNQNAQQSGKKFYLRWRDFVKNRADSLGSMNSYLEHYDSVVQGRAANRTMPGISSGSGCVKDGVYNEVWERFGYENMSSSNQHYYGVGWVYDVSFSWNTVCWR